MTKKYIADYRVVERLELSSRYVRLLMEATDAEGVAALAASCAGQFAQVRVDGLARAMLRRPISISRVDPEKGQLQLVVGVAGEGSRWLCERREGDTINVILPLGHGFTIVPEVRRCLLVGGGVGVAPLLFLGETMTLNGLRPSFLLGARTEGELLLREDFEKLGTTYLSTDDGTAGAPGVVTLNPALEERWDAVYCCGPLPMMKGVAKICKEREIACEVSLENRMACGLGACLCCVEPTVKGNVCTCTEGPVFNINQLKW